MFKKNSFNSFPNNAKLQGKHLIDVSVLTTAVSTFANRAFCRIESLNTIQAQRRAAGDGSGRKYSEKYVFMTKNMTFGPLGYVLTL